MKDTENKRIPLDDELEGVNGGNILIGRNAGSGLRIRLSNLLHTGGKATATTLPSTDTGSVVLSSLEMHSGTVSDDIDKRDLAQARAEEDQQRYSI